MNYEYFCQDKNPAALIIAEAGINHDGDLESAKQLVNIASKSKADYVKFQSFEAKKLVTPSALTSSYIDAGSRDGESFEDLLSRLELTRHDHSVLKDCCDEKRIKFLSTAFDERSFDMLVDLGIDLVKVASGDLTNIPLIRYMASHGLPMVVSTGMATMGEIENAVDAISIKEDNDRIILLHCISWYPAAIETTNLRFIETLKSAFGYPVGYSDHTLGINMAIAARALGALVIEKHFTLSTNQFGPDHAASLGPQEFSAMVRGIREVEEGMGSSVRQFSDEEISQRNVHRRSLVARTKIEPGNLFSEDNITLKRPGTGLAPKYWYEVIGKKAKTRLEAEQVLSRSDIDW